MPTSSLLPSPNDEDDEVKRNDLKPKKDLVIQPLHDSIKQTPVPEAPEIPGASEDLLSELRSKTAELAEKIGGEDPVRNRVLELESNEDVKDILDELDPNPKKSAKQSSNHLEPNKNGAAHAADPAVLLVREKLAKIYKKEPDAAEEAIESYQAGERRSIHQQFMYNLTTSGKSLADIQTEWHNYYVELPDHAKHGVWKEFYENQRQTSRYATAQKPKVKPKRETQQKKQPKPSYKSIKPKSVKAVKSQIIDKVSAGGKLSATQHIKSLLFGLGLASIVGLIITFTFFNEVFIAPFISPSQTVSATPIIGPQSGPVDKAPKIIIPKINLEVPVVFDLGSIKEKEIQNALEDGVVHYASTPNPGEKGNTVIVGHSSNNILNSGKYKFAFVLLKRLEIEDTFFVHKDGVRYTYKIYKKEVVKPGDTSVLRTQDKANTITLITCDPPGTSINRLIVTAEQISPDPTGNKTSTAPELDGAELEELPSNAPSLWSRVWPF